MKNFFNQNRKWIGFFLIFIAVILMCTYFFLSKKKDEKIIPDTKNTTVISNSEDSEDDNYTEDNMDELLPMAIDTQNIISTKTIGISTPDWNIEL